MTENEPKIFTDGELKDLRKAIDRINEKPHESESRESSIEKTFSTTQNTLFGKDNLLMTSRPSKEFSMYFLRLLIVRRFFYNAWRNVSMQYEVKETKTPPYYEFSCNVIGKGNALYDAWRLNMFDEFLDEVLMLLISVEGKGRQEAVDIMKAAVTILRENELKKMSYYGGIDPTVGSKT